jgi:hypothetical protein
MVQSTKLTVLTIIAAASASANAQEQAIPGNVGQYYKYRGNTPPLATATFSDSTGNSWGVCTQFCRNRGLNENDMKGNIHTLPNQFECQCFDARQDVVLVKNGDATWKTFKGNLAMTDTVVSSRKANRKVLQAEQQGDDEAEPGTVGSTAQGYGWKWVGTAVASHTFTASDPWTTCNPYCSNAKGLNQYNMAGTAIITGDQIQCSCFNTNKADTKLVSASPTNKYYAFSGSHV